MRLNLRNLILISIALCQFTVAIANPSDRESGQVMFPTPSEMPSKDEVFDTGGPLYHEGRELLYARIDDSREKYGWKCDVKSIRVSANADFDMIVRADVVWTINGDVVEASDMLWRDREGNQGVSSDILDVAN